MTQTAVLLLQEGCYINPICSKRALPETQVHSMQPLPFWQALTYNQVVHSALP